MSQQPTLNPTNDDDLVARAAAGESLTGLEAENLLDYWLANGSLPGHDEPVKLELKAGHGKAAKTFRCRVRGIQWEEHQKSIEAATGEDGGLDRVVLSAYNAARALIEPDLGPAWLRMRDEAASASDKKCTHPNGGRIDPPKDTAHLLLLMLRDEPGLVLELGEEVLKISKLSASSERSIREIEAGKG